MTVLHVRESGAVVRRDAERVRVTVTDRATRRSKELAAMPVRELEQVVLYGNVQVTTQATALLLQNEVDVVLLSALGTYRGRIIKDGSKFARLRHQQLRRSDNARQSLAMAIPLVQAKLAGQADLQRTLAQQVEQTKARRLTQAAAGIEEMRKAATRASSLDALRGYEGKGSALHFGAIRLLLDAAWSFQSRQYYPPPDPFNAMLSFGYTLLQKDIETVAVRVGLDPYIGCLHTLEYGRPSLVLDLMEEFRPRVVDYAMLDLVLGGKLLPKDFTFTGRKERPVELGQALIPLVLQAYEARANDRIRHKPSDSEQRLRACYELQARIYARTILGRRSNYQGVGV